jgi:hypothetical protein
MSKKSEKEIQEEIRKNLEGLLGDDVLSAPLAKTDANMDMDGMGERLEHPNAQPMNLHEVKDEVAKDAKNALKSLIDFYLGAKFIAKNDYAKYKRRIDEMSLSNMMFAMRTAQLAVIKLLEEIDMGNTHPRNFEALVSLNGQMMNMIKHQQALFVTMEEGYKKIKADQAEVDDENRTEDVDSEDITFGGITRTRGTKMLMSNLQKTIKAKVADDAETDETSVPRLTDARNRPANHIPGADRKTEFDDESDEIYGGLDEHF